MKKNRMMRLASVLLVCVLLTTSVISGTFAKYVSTNEANDTARVAKWGFNDATFTFDLFSDVYSTTVNGQGTNVIAPGTKQTAAVWFVPDAMAAPEVAYSIEVSTDKSSIDANIEANPNIVWQLDDKGWGTWDDMLADIEALSATAAPNTIPAAFESVHEISWMWVFDETADVDGVEVDTVNDYANNDINDTNMGNIAADGTDLKVELVITITATQID